ncbi:hypothetical protein N836_28060 [Leptolyngbya sp. Heron Island J]|uniref:hypothetical protein n=1 Tax=Leptolyngbya sp. Heron Island J TaxID=1385935 RepID=UPI0003B9DF8C|nr:hypothetical protein [Leptolyngbya sp. Heron Island J]ESA32012.1 hypothetical protein N836_28060 [Leptolyngbya sp. Heron Island J]
MNQGPKPNDVEEWFPLAIQNQYIEHIVHQPGLRITRRQATYFVRLWGYGYLIQRGINHAPITHLNRQIDSFYCSHSDAADLFYTQTQGTPRAAGQMLDKLASKTLLRRGEADGVATRVSLNIPQNFELPEEEKDDSFYPDNFDPRNDATLVANILEKLYSYDPERPESMLHNIKRGIRQWARQYPDGLRVLRRMSTKEPVGFAAFLPAHPDSEEKFDLSPSRSLHLSRLDVREEDPIKVATKGDPDCYTVFVRSWQIELNVWTYETACEFIEDSRITLKKIRDDFPNLSDIYTIAIHPLSEDFALTLGFRMTKADPDSSLRWLYMPLDRFLDLDYEDVLLNFDYSHRYS